jgi:hypothetical protein
MGRQEDDLSTYMFPKRDESVQIREDRFPVATLVKGSNEVTKH